MSAATWFFLGMFVGQTLAYVMLAILLWRTLEARK
jgi:hypothetical protein